MDGNSFVGIILTSVVSGMPRVASSRSAVRQDRSPRTIVLAVVAISVLAISLATHTGTPTLLPDGIAQSHVAHAMRQQLDTDATESTPPVVWVAVSAAVSFYPEITPQAPAILSYFFEESVYNRPPPAC